MMVLCTVATSCGNKSNEQQTEVTFPAIDLSNMDLSINPAEDFFRYTNNNWLKNNPIPEEYTTYGAFTEIDQRNEILIQDIIKEASNDADAVEGSVAQKIRDFYNAGMDTVAINERGYSELIPYFDRINAISDKGQLGEMLGFMHNNGFRGLFSAGGGADPKPT